MNTKKKLHRHRLKLEKQQRLDKWEKKELDRDEKRSRSIDKVLGGCG